MLIEILFFTLVGTILGTVTGLIPGIHTNLIGTILIFLISNNFLKTNYVYIAVIISSMAITHTFLDFIPSIFLGVPDEGLELTTLPSHKFLKQGLGYAAILLNLYGSISAIIILLLITYPSIYLMQKINPFLQNIIPYLVILIVIIMILLERKKLSAILVLFLTGTLGFLILNNSNISEPLLPLLTGLFGSSALILSIKSKTKIPKQKIIKPSAKISKPLLGSLIAAPLCSFLPGVGSSQAAVIGNIFTKNNSKEFLILTGAINTLVVGFSFVSLYAIDKNRTGAAAAINSLLPNFSGRILILILFSVVISGIISYFLTIFFAKLFSNHINKINYTLLCFITLGIIVTITIMASGIFGFFILIISTFTGIYCIKKQVKRSFMMGCLMIPTIFYYLF